MWHISSTYYKFICAEMGVEGPAGILLGAESTIFVVFVSSGGSWTLMPLYLYCLGVLKTLYLYCLGACCGPMDAETIVLVLSGSSQQSWLAQNTMFVMSGRVSGGSWALKQLYL